MDADMQTPAKRPDWASLTPEQQESIAARLWANEDYQIFIVGRQEEVIRRHIQAAKIAARQAASDRQDRQVADLLALAAEIEEVIYGPRDEVIGRRQARAKRETKATSTLQKPMNP